MSEVRNANRKPLTVIETVGLLVTALGALPAYAGAMGMFMKGHDMSGSSTLGMIAGWDHPALLIGGLVTMALGGVMGFASYRMSKQ
jgi:hypothetical protein